MRIVVDEDGWVLESDEAQAKAEKGSPGSGVYPKASRTAEPDDVALSARDMSARDMSARDMSARDMSAREMVGATDPAPPFDIDGDGLESIPPPASIPRDIAAWADESDGAAGRMKPRVA